MTDREKLIELLHKEVRCPGTVANCMDCPYQSNDTPCDEFAATADMLIAHGVTIREQGEWEIITDDDGNEMMECSRCGSAFYDDDNDTVACLHNFCPNCGAEMKGKSNA